MFIEQKLKVFRDVKEENMKNLYYPGTWVDKRIEEIPAETKELTPLYTGMWLAPWDIPKRTKEGKTPFVNAKFQRYRIPESLRQASKRHILTRLDIVPVSDDVTKYPESVAGQISPQKPTAFPELAGFDEVTEAAPTAVKYPTLGTWGNLISNLTTMYFGVEQAKAQAKLTEAQAALAEAQPKPITAGITTALPLILLTGLGIFLATKKKKK